MIHRTALHVASFIENQFTINAKSSAFGYINWYRAFKFRYTWIMVARLKVNKKKCLFFRIRTFSTYQRLDTNEIIFLKCANNHQTKRLMNFSVIKLEFIVSMSSKEFPMNLILNWNFRLILWYPAFQSQHHRQWRLCINLVQKCWNYHVDWMLCHRLLCPYRPVRQQHASLVMSHEPNCKCRFYQIVSSICPN